MKMKLLPPLGILLLSSFPNQYAGRYIHLIRATKQPDGEILEIQQVTAYVNYASSGVLGLGCSTYGDILGLLANKSDIPDD